jgi:hypothetical protein
LQLENQAHGLTEINFYKEKIQIT